MRFSFKQVVLVTNELATIHLLINVLVTITSYYYHYQCTSTLYSVLCTLYSTLVLVLLTTSIK